MSITTHPGFRTALAESGLTASEAIFIISSVEQAEQALAGCSRSETGASQVRGTSAPRPRSNPIQPDENERKCDDLLYRQEPSSPSQSSLASPPYKVQDGQAYDLSGQKWSRS